MLSKTPRLRTLFGDNINTSSCNPFVFPDFFLNTPTRSAQLSAYLCQHPKLSSYIQPIYNDEGLLTAHEVDASGIRHVLDQKRLPIAIYSTQNDLEMLFEKAVPNKQHIAIVNARVFQNTKNDCHFHAIVYEKSGDGSAQLYVYDPYRGTSITTALLDYLHAHQISIFYPDTPRSYALKGTSFAYAIGDIERLFHQTTQHAIVNDKNGMPAFKLGSPFRYNGLEVKRSCFQLLVDTVEEDMQLACKIS